MDGRGKASDAPAAFPWAFPAAAQASTILGIKIASQKYSPIALSNCRSRQDVRVGLAGQQTLHRRLNQVDLVIEEAAIGSH
jgi:hypothetical protein